MSVSRPLSKLCAAALCLWAGAASAQTAPKRVVSVNLCTDQLAMLLAAPGQLLSVSHLALDPLSSAMVEEAGAYEINRGGVEQVFLMQPDLILASVYTAPDSLALWRSLGVEVFQLPIVTRLSEVPEQIRMVASVLGQVAAGEAMVAEFEAGLSAQTSDLAPVTAALYHANGYTSGAGTLADDLLTHAGFANLGREAGLTGGGNLPLERLVMEAPRMIMTARPYAGASRAEEILSHPALEALRETSGVLVTDESAWGCAIPHLIGALANMSKARESLE